MPRLRVLAGPTDEDLVPITDIVNTGQACTIVSEYFEGKIAIYVKNFVDPNGRRLTNEYFEREDRKGITWSIQVQGWFLQPHSADDILFGNIFEKRLKLPWGSGAALKFMQFIDPTLEYDLTSSKPWALSPLIATMPHFTHERLDSQSDIPPFPPPVSISDDTSQLWTTSTSSIRQPRSCAATPPSFSRTSFSTSWSSSSDTSYSSVRSSLRDNVNNTLKRSLEKAHIRWKGTKCDMNFRTPSERRSFFSSPQHRQEVVLGPQDLVTTDFCYGYLEFSPTLALRLPGGISFDLVRYWDKHPVKFICCERKKASLGEDDGEPIGNVFWCVSFEEDDEEDEEESGEPANGRHRCNPEDIQLFILSGHSMFFFSVGNYYFPPPPVLDFTQHIMIQICRAEDGESFQVSATLRDIERRGSLESFLHQEIGVDQDAILAYLSDGTRLRTDNVRELVGAQDQTIYVFNKHYLDIEFPEVLRELRVEPPLQPIEGTLSFTVSRLPLMPESASWPWTEVLSATPPYKPSHLAAQYLRSAHVYLDYVTHTLATLHRQHESVRIACSSLDFNTLDITDVFDGIAVTASRDLARQESLLTFVDADLEIINRVDVHVEFMSPTMRKAIEGGERPRMLGTYVARDRMKLVADGCARIHNDLRTQFSESEKAVGRLTAGAEVVRSTVANTKIVEDAEASGRRFHDALDKASEIAAALESPAMNHDALMQELKQLDGVLRHEVEVMTCAKNDYTEQCIGALRRISILNVDLVQLPSALSQLQPNFERKLISHIYNIVRRKEFARFFYQRAQSILEVMAKLSANEKKRRQVYRGEVHGQLPFDTRGMDDPVPAIDFSPSGGKDSAYSLEREDVDAFLQVVHDLEEYARASSDSAVLNSVQEARFALEKLVQKMDNLEAGFDRIAERSLLSTSRLSASRRKLTEADEIAFQELSEQLCNTEGAKAQLEHTMQQERAASQAEIHRLHKDVEKAVLAVQSERERADALERELHQAKAQIESEVSVRRILERRNAELAQDVEGQRRERAKALGDATEQARCVRKQRKVKTLEAKNAAKVNQLLEEQTATLRNLEEARSRGEDLESQIRTARAENDEVNRMLRESNMEKDRLLRVQATEHDRMLRDHIAEADGDRAVLEHQFSELREQLEDANRRLKDAHANVDLTNADAMGLREELQRVEHELREARHVERLLLEDVAAGRVSQSDFEQSLENSGRLLAQMLDVAIAFRNAHSKALSMVRAYTTHPNAKQGQSQSSHPHLVESAFSPPPLSRHDVIAEEPSPIDPSDPVGALELLRTFDHDHFLDAVAKTGTIIRKWQKQCKEYRERAKGKISFRNFAKGDLALFLPTRNSVSKPWAAFNVSFPHYFLLATGHLAEQLKTREWIVARITSIAERVDPTSNPYGLGDGIKYYMLEVEDWTQSGQVNKRRPNLRKVSAVSDPESERKSTSVTPERPPIPPGPPQAEVEDSFSVTQPPTSHLFPARPRANSTPSAGPSSLSRLLAQASPEPSEEPTSVVVPRSKAEAPIPPPSSNPEPSPSPQPQPPPPSPSLSPKRVSVPSPPSVPPPAGTTSQPRTSSPLRPGSRASRISTTSRISTARPPTLATVTSSPAAVKAAATTALTEPMFSADPFSSEPVLLTGPPSRSESFSDGMSQLLINRRRTASHHIARVSPLRSGSGSGSGASVVPGALPHTQTQTYSRTQAQFPPPTASSTLATFASNWVVPFGRRKKAETVAVPAPTSPSFTETSTGTGNGQAYYDASSGSAHSKSKDMSASEMLKRL
ncbi:hypothetical protein J3R83DRAFT_9785 [Lanmaoa asiatica]|nr:hypothetical protein J3R83DRAFT_9785 [Lanmaoa asiatica]